MKALSDIDSSLHFLNIGYSLIREGIILNGSKDSHLRAIRH
jgi:hypothetical protein